MNEKDIERIQDLLLAQVESSVAKGWIRRVGAAVIKLVVVVAVVTSVTGFITNGTEFFTKRIPSTASWAFGTLIYSNNMLPYLSGRVVKQQLGLQSNCASDTYLADFDQDDAKTDLIISIDLPIEDICDGGSQSSIYAIFKEIDGDGFWPSYTLLRLIRVADFGEWNLGSGYPISFDVNGRFVVASIGKTDFPGHIIYGYANGTLHQFGSFRPLGALRENPQSSPASQIGDHLFLSTKAGMKQFTITTDGEFVQSSMSAKEIVARNNATIVIEDEENFSDEVKRAIKSPNVDHEGNSRSEYVVSGDEKAPCFRKVFANGQLITFEQQGKPVTCSATLDVLAGSNFISNVPCTYTGFSRSTDFPQGWQPVAGAVLKIIQCIEDGENDGSIYKITLNIVDKF